MNYQLLFTQLIDYDAGQPGITIEVTLSLSEEQVSCTAKLDTGSTFCLFSRKIGEDLGLTIESGLRRIIGTVTGTFAVYLHQVNLIVAGCSLSALVGFAEDDTFQRNVLGRHGFLEQVTLGLVDYEGKLYLSQYGDE